jgi:hypothetical protein
VKAIFPGEDQRKERGAGEALLDGARWSWRLHAIQTEEETRHSQAYKLKTVHEIGSTPKQGNSNVRWLLVEVAHHAGRHPGPLGHQFQRIARKKGVNVARVAIARKLAVLAWNLLTKGEPYRYASPVATEKKLADLRRSQHVLHPPHLGNRGSHWGHSTRLRKSLATVLATESLPAASAPPAAETRVFAPLGTTALLEHLGREQRVEVAHRVRSPHQGQSPSKKAQKRISTRARKH